MPVRVLIVDDSIVARNELRHHLERMGCEVVGDAENTLRALAMFRTESPSLVILSVAVPQTGGIGALALLRIMRTLDPKAQVLMIGTSALPEVRKSFVREGALDYLRRPSNFLDFEQIRKRLEELFPQLIRVPQASRHAILEQGPIMAR
jgi:DNA-binding NtrC family response regulator